MTLRLTCADGQMTLMTIITGGITRAVLPRLVRALPQITPKENTVGIDTDRLYKAQCLVIIPFVTKPVARRSHVM